MILIPSASYAVDAAATDTGHLGNNQWHVQSDGDLVADDEDSQDIYADSIVLGGVTLDGTIERAVQFGLEDFVAISTARDYFEELTASTIPGIEVDNSKRSIVWSDSEVTPVQVAFKVPADYNSGGAFRVYCDSSAYSSQNAIDFDVRVDNSGDGVTSAAWDTASTNQTPASLDNLAGSPDLVVLSVTTDFASLAANDLVTIAIWRSNASGTYTGDLEMYYAEFYYTANE